MKIYWEVIKFNFSKMLAYPWEMAAFFAGRIITLGFLLIFWYAVAKSNPGNFDFRHLLAYFLVVSAVKDLTLSTENKFGAEIQRIIKYGEINNFLIKPIKEIPFMVAGFIGGNGAQFFYAGLTFLLGLLVHPPQTPLNLIGFVAFLFVTFLVSISMNVFAGMLSFYSPEAKGIKNVLDHTIRILSGALIPLIYFPALAKKIVMLTPFPSLAFTPAYILQNQISLAELSYLFLVGIFWAIFLLILSNYLWKKSLKNYEGVGI